MHYRNTRRNKYRMIEDGAPPIKDFQNEVYMRKLKLY